MTANFVDVSDFFINPCEHYWPAVVIDIFSMAYAESKHQITLIIEVTISLFELGQIALEDGTEAP